MKSSHLGSVDLCFSFVHIVRAMPDLQGAKIIHRRGNFGFALPIVLILYILLRHALSA